jgi:putative transposase
MPTVFVVRPLLFRDQLRQATNGNFVLGNDRFAEEIRLALGRRVTSGKAGRPKKTAPPESGQLF